ncbi:MAG: hypothetical protein WC655_11970 [Candidatus Hydrogenedentales bacterium]
MRPRWANLNAQDNAAFRAVTAFLNGRLEERETIDWALRLGPNDKITRIALLRLINDTGEQSIAEPWLSAWRLIGDSWTVAIVDDQDSIDLYQVQERLNTGDRSGSLISTIVNLVKSRLSIQLPSDLDLHPQRRRKRPRAISELISAFLTSGQLVNPEELGLGDLTDHVFLVSLAHELDAAVVNGLDIARRFGWHNDSGFWQMGGLYRVYFVSDAERGENEDEPDALYRGIAPSVKLLHAVVARLVDLDVSIATGLVRCWRFTDSPVHIRLWAAISRDSRVTSPAEAGIFLSSLKDSVFWDLHSYPEIAELRAKRFSELDLHDQKAIIARIRKLPPRSQWPGKHKDEPINSMRTYWAVRELRRIEIAGVSLPKRDKAWIDKRVAEFPELLQMSRVEEGFPISHKAYFVAPSPDTQYDLLDGNTRLKALEVALSQARRGWTDDPVRGAQDWMDQPGKTLKLLMDFEATPDAGASYPRTWSRFCLQHTPTLRHGEYASQPDLRSECVRVLLLLGKLPAATIRQAIEGISHWLASWKEQVVVLPEGLPVWFKVWPIAVEATNEKHTQESAASFNVSLGPSDERDPIVYEILNTPTGKLIGVFLEACPECTGTERPFDIGGPLRRMRDTIIAASGRSRVIVLFRLIEGLPYFIHADPDWTQEHLISILRTEHPDVISLWRAIGGVRLSRNVIESIGESMLERATDSMIDRRTRQSIVLRFVVECLYALFEDRIPAVPYHRVEQMIRSLDDEVRVHGAETIQRFVRDATTPSEGVDSPPSREELFRRAVKPFLHKVWPQERSLATPSISRALADLPAAAREDFVEAVATIERFLVPFDCWSIRDFGLYGTENGEVRLSVIDSPAKASAFLRMLDLVISTAEGTVIPHDLAVALEHIRTVAPELIKKSTFRRLATAARGR